ncbi:LysR substrate-binding domain-containing protein [Streptomyces lydicus]
MRNSPRPDRTPPAANSVRDPYRSANGPDTAPRLKNKREVIEKVADPVPSPFRRNQQRTGRTDLVVNIISGSGTPGLWGTTQPGRPIVEVNNVDEWLEAVAAGRGIGVSASSTATLHPHPGVICVPLKDAAPVSVLITWRSLDSHPHTAHFVAAAKRWSRSRAHA